MQTPNVTQAQVLALIASIVGLLVSQGAIENETAKQITGIAAIALPLAWVIADAIIRHGRAKVAAALITQKSDLIDVPPVQPPPMAGGSGEPESVRISGR